MTNNSLPHADYEKYRGLRALLLTRVSSPGQSHEAQERVIREKLIQPLGLYLDEEKHVVHDTYTGLEYRYRAALDEILRMAERREFDLLCLDVLDRGLGRKGVSREVFRGQLRELGIHILSTEQSDHADDDSLEGQLMRLLKGYKAEEEVNDFVRRSKNAIRHKALGDPEKGIPPKVVGNTSRLYGYKYVLSPKGKRETLEPNYDVIWVDSKGVAWTEVRVVVFMFRCAKRRISLRAIARRLNDIGIPAPSISKGNKSKSKGIQAEKLIWQASVVSRTLRHTGYSGKQIINKYRTAKVPGRKWRQYTLTPKEEQIIVPIPALVSEEWQAEIMKNLEQNRRWARRNNRQPELTLSRGGLGKCGNCGRNLSLQRRTNYYKSKPEGQRLHIFYRCSTKSTGTLHKCRGCYVSAITLDNAAWEKALEIIRDPSIVDAEIAKRKSDDPTASRRKQINKELASINAERNDLQATLLRMIRERKLDRNTENVLTSRLKQLEKLEYEYNSELLDDDKIHRQWEATQRKLDKLHQKCAVMREKLNDPTYEPNYETKRELIEFFGIVAIVWDNEHHPKFKIQAKFAEIVLQFP
jgi:site-specific DNA recombinase